ncbi:MAG: PaaI family thioesterase [Thermomicrobium sp.]|nr:PaaI family thioesterase [Thermomicrobium sp.]
MDDKRVNRITDHACFGCGDRNPIGLRLAFYRRGDAVEAAFAPRPEHEGYIGFVHGGILATLLDEAMSWAVIAATKRLMVTARLSIAYRHPVLVGRPLRVRGWVVEQRHRSVRARAELRADGDDRVLAEAEGTFLPVAPEQERAWRQRYLQSASGGDAD